METIWIVPPALGVIGLAIYATAWLLSRRFDRKHPHLSRKGMRQAELREDASRAATRRPPIPVPPFHPEEWRMQSARDESESERLDRSLTRWGEQMASRPKTSTEAPAPIHR